MIGIYKKTLKLLATLLLAGVFFLLPACSYVTYVSPTRTVVTDHSPNSLVNLQLGRQYVAEGRYELAKEHYLMALAASDDQNRESIAQELHSVDMMIKTQR